MKKTKFFSLYLFIAAIVIFSADKAGAARLYIDPQEHAISRNGTLVAKIKIDTEGQCVNAVESGLIFGEMLELVDFSTGNSIFPLWIDRPDKDAIAKANRERRFTFSGGIPGGFCGMITGDIGESNIIAEAVFKAKDIPAELVGRSEIAILPESTALLNDGKGTAAPLTLRSAFAEIMSGAEATTSEWQKRISEDKNPPEPFIISIERNASMFGNNYFIVFQAYDKQTGIDRYEVQEIPIDSLKPPTFWQRILQGFYKKPAPLINWQSASSPHELKDQALSSIIKVKAYDKSGNERIAEYVPEIDKEDPDSYISLVLILVCCMLIACVLLLTIKKRKNA